MAVPQELEEAALVDGNSRIGAFFNIVYHVNGNVADGAELGSAVHDYANAVIERELPATGKPLPPQWALQDPDDWLEVLRRAVPAAVVARGGRRRGGGGPGRGP